MTNKTYKTFDDLEFKPHIPEKALRAIVPIVNGWKISVIEYLGIYADIYRRYECACIREEGRYIDFMCVPGMTEVIFFCSDRSTVDYVMKKFQKIAEDPLTLHIQI